MTEDQIREAIQVGTDRKVVEAFLGDHQIEYSILEGEALSLEPDLAGSPYPVVSRYVARVPNVRRRMLVYKESILIRIDVGSHGSVLDVKVERAATGP